ncbi:MAG: PqqD family protein [Planctomycetota bacterium]|nr:MAG: PqqD family protein [Planctomycetota bacterium]
MAMNHAEQADLIANAILRLHPETEIIEDRNQRTVNLRGPMLRRGRISAWIAWLLRLPQRVEVELDDIGTFVIQHLEGHTMESLSDLLADQYKLTRREAQAAMTVFVKSLLQRRLLILDGMIGNAA